MGGQRPGRAVSKHVEAPPLKSLSVKFLSIFRPLNSLQISKRLRLLDSLNVSKHFIRPLNSLFPSPGLRHVAYARPLGSIMLLMRPRGPAPGAADTPDARLGVPGWTR